MIKNDSIFTDLNLNAEIEKNARRKTFKSGEIIIKPGDEIIYIPIVKRHLFKLSYNTSGAFMTSYVSKQPNSHGLIDWTQAENKTWGTLIERQTEIVKTVGLKDCRTHAKTWDLLRMTRMPSVRIEVGYLSNTNDAVKLADANVRDLIASSIAEAIISFFEPVKN
jgi:hypothetical protein